MKLGFKELGLKAGARIASYLLLKGSPESLAKASRLMRVIAPKRHKSKIDFVREKFEQRHCALMFALKILRDKT